MLAELHFWSAIPSHAEPLQCRPRQLDVRPNLLSGRSGRFSSDAEITIFACSRVARITICCNDDQRPRQRSASQEARRASTLSPKNLGVGMRERNVYDNRMRVGADIHQGKHKAKAIALAGERHLRLSAWRALYLPINPGPIRVGSRQVIE